MSCCEVQVSLHEQLLPAVSQNPWVLCCQARLGAYVSEKKDCLVEGAQKSAPIHRKVHHYFYILLLLFLLFIHLFIYLFLSIFFMGPIFMWYLFVKHLQINLTLWNFWLWFQAHHFRCIAASCLLWLRSGFFVTCCGVLICGEAAAAGKMDGKLAPKRTKDWPWYNR